MMAMMEAADSDSVFTSSASIKTPLWPGRAYSSALSKSVRAMMAPRRVLSSKQVSESDSVADAAQFADAVARKDKEKMLDALAKNPSILRQSDANGWLPLHQVCYLRPNHRFIDLMTMMVSTYPDAVHCGDKTGKTPLHVLCGNNTVTVEALAVFAESLPKVTLVHDNNGNLPLHDLCRNPACDIEKIKLLGSAMDQLSTVNDEGQTPVHCLVMAILTPNATVLLHLIKCFPDAALIHDKIGRTILHWACEHQELDESILQKLLSLVVDTPALPDENGDLPLHILCQNVKITRDLLRLALQMHASSVCALAKNDLSPLHFLCTNEMCSVDLLTEFFSFDSDNSSCGILDKFGATALHLLCMNESISTDIMRTMLLMCPEDSFIQDVHGCSPLHYMCMNQAVTSEMLWLFFDRGNELTRQVDKDGRTPLHYLCNNIRITPRILEVLFDAWPSAALVADLEFKLPVQYLVDNPSSSSDITALLVCGPASYRHRYEFLSTTGQSVCFTQDGEMIYVQTNVAMDATTASNVLVTFYSSPLIAGHEHNTLLHLKTAAETRADPVDYYPSVHEMFDGAKRRVALRGVDVAPEDQNGDSVILDHALVTEAPLYTLQAFSAEKLCDAEAVHAIVTEVAKCLLFWHCDAHLVHGNITLQNVGQFEGRGLCLYNLSTSRGVHHQRSIGSRSISLSACPPEAAKLFVAKEEFVPTPASDIWQFGCLVYQLATGSTLLERLAPWADSVGYEQGLHLICSLTEGVIEPLIAEVDSKFRLLLQRTLVLNPSYRWGIDRLMCISDQSSPPIFSISEASSASFIGSRLTQNESDTSIDVDGGPRIAKHAQEQLEFMRKEQSHLRHSLLAAKLQLRKCDQKRANLQLHVEGLRAQVVSEAQQRKEAQLEAQLLARNHQSMTHQLHTTVQVLLNLVPLARKVYGVAADDFLSFALSQTTENGSPPAFPTSPSNAGREEGPVQLLKTQLQNSVLAHGCIQKWANSTTSSAMARAEIESSGVDEEIPGGDNVRKPPIFSTTTSSSSEVEDTDSSAAAVA